MLLRFGVFNHRSIRDYQEVKFTVSSLKDDESGLIYPGFDDITENLEAKIKIVPVTAIYGANASGKSTFLEALDFLVDAIKYSHRRTTSSSKTPYNPFMLDEDSKRSPSGYDIDFALDDTRYHYGFTVDGKRIVSEWLYSFPLKATRSVRSVLFHRDHTEKEEYYFGKSLKGENKQIARLTRDNVLFISSAAQNSHPQLSQIYDYFSEKVMSRMHRSENTEYIGSQVFAYFSEDNDKRERALSFLKAADIGISGMDFSKVPFEEDAKKMLDELDQLLSKYSETPTMGLSEKERIQVEFFHHGNGGKKYSIKLQNESSGTLALLQILGPVFQVLNDGGILIIDELNTYLHPLVSKELVKLFSSRKTNPKGAQLISSTHDTNMLSAGLLRRDQFWFAEKDNSGVTHIYSLSDIKVRKEDNFERGYIEGRFGAVPLFGLFGNDYTREKFERYKNKE
jgi:uncharacterized protein